MDVIIDANINRDTQHTKIEKSQSPTKMEDFDRKSEGKKFRKLNWKKKLKQKYKKGAKEGKSISIFKKESLTMTTTTIANHIRKL